MACRVISRITDSVKCSTLSLRKCLGRTELARIAGRLAHSKTGLRTPPDGNLDPETQPFRQPTFPRNSLITGTQLSACNAAFARYILFGILPRSAVRRFILPLGPGEHEESNSRDNPQNRGKHGGVGVPAKGDSSGSNPPLDADSPTLIDLPAKFAHDAITGGASAPPHDPDATIIEGMLPPLPPLSSRYTRPVAPSPMLNPGDVLGGRYEILQLLGEGGMGAVYKAQDRELERPVALKLIRPEMASSPSILARFKQELLLSRQVTHKNVIRIYDLGDADGVKFI